MADISTQSLGLLESRLRRLSFVLTGSIDGDIVVSANSKESAAARLRSLDRQLSQLLSKSFAASQALDLYHKHPSVFRPNVKGDTTTELAPHALAALILAHSRSYQQMATELSSLTSSTLPDPAVLAKVVELRPRVNKAAIQQAQLKHRTADLRSRSAQLLDLWYAEGMLDMTENWTEWEERLRDIEILVRRMEAAKKRADDLV